MTGHRNGKTPPAALPRHIGPEHLPPELLGLPRWTPWGNGDTTAAKLDKYPWIETNQPGKWLDYSAAVQAATGKVSGFDVQAATGVGFQVAGQDKYVVLDADHVVTSYDPDTRTATFTERGARLVKAAGGMYVEVSPSATGLRLIGTRPPSVPVVARTTAHKFPDGEAVEVYGRDSAKYATITGCALAGHEGQLGEVPPTLLAFLQAEGVPVKWEREEAPRHEAPALPPGGALAREVERAREALAARGPEHFTYEEWVAVGQALHAGLGDEGFALWDEWSAGDPREGKYPGTEILRVKWRSFHAGGGVTLGTLYHLLREEESPAEAAQEGAEPLGRLVRLDISQDPPPVRWLLHHAIPAGKAGVFAGPGGIGKSTWVAGLAVHRAHGVPYLGRAVLPGPTLLVSAEDGAEDYHAAFASWRAHIGLPPHMVEGVERSVLVLDLVGAGFKLAHGDYTVAVDDKAVARLVARIREACEANEWDPSTLLVVLETYSRMSSGEENKDASASLAAAERITREVPGATVMFVHHQSKAANKAGDADSTGARGGQALSDNARFLLMLTRPTQKAAKEEDPEEVKHLAVFTPAKVNRAPPQEGEELLRVSVQLTHDSGWVYVSRAEAFTREVEAGSDMKGAMRARRDDLIGLLLALRETVSKATARGEVVTGGKLRKKGEAGLLDAFTEECRAHGIHGSRKTEKVTSLVDEALRRGYLVRGTALKTGGHSLSASPTIPTQETPEGRE